MRTFLLHAAAWASALQSVGTPPGIAGDPAHLIGAAGVLGSVTVFVYRLGVWRQQMENTRESAVSQIAKFREELTAVQTRLDRLEGGS